MGRDRGNPSHDPSTVSGVSAETLKQADGEELITGNFDGSLADASETYLDITSPSENGVFVSVDKVTLVTSGLGAVATGVDIELVEINSDGTVASSQTLAAGDGGTTYLGGAPPNDQTIDTSSGVIAGIRVSNTSGASVDIIASATGSAEKK